MWELLLREIKDVYTRENFFRLKTSLTEQVLLRGGWKFFDITFTGAVTNFKYAHNLKFTPKDVIQTSLTGAGALTWNYSEFDKDTLDITTTGACTVRAFVGSYREEV